jgi:hypothetical protein
MLMIRVCHALPGLMLFVALSSGAAEAVPHTRIALDHRRWLINGRLTNPDSAAEGLLMNVRMVNAVFEDRTKHPEFDPEANTARFIARVPEYAAHGVNANNQRFPFHFDGAADDPVFYAELKKLTARGRNQR